MARYARSMQVVITAVTIVSLFVLYVQTTFAQTTVMKTQTHSQLCPQLPAGFNPETASISQLQYFHLPLPPTDAIQRAAWIKELKHIKHIDCDSSFTSTSMLSHPVVAKAPVTIPGATTNDDYWVNWAGYHAKNDHYDDIKANWNTQCLGSNQASDVREVSWVGLGGVNGNGLWQAGTIYTSDGLYHPWWEAYPYNGIQVDWNISAGCAVSVSSEVHRSGNSWCYYVNVDGFVTSGCPLTTSQFSADQSTADWIDERPHCSNGWSHLADFNYTSYSNVYAHSTVRNWHTLLGFPTDKDHMVDNNNGNILAEPDNPSSSTTFTDRYKNKDTDGVNCNGL